MRRLVPLLVAIPVLIAGLTVALRPAANAQKEASPLALVGDGTTDNTTAIRAMLRRDGTVHFPRGTFRITEPIVIELANNGPAAITSDGNATLLMDGPG